MLSLVAVAQVVHWASKVPEAISSQRSLNAVDRPTIYTFYDVYEEPTEDDIDLLAVWKKKWWDAGWIPIVLTIQNAKKHVDFNVVKDRLPPGTATLSMQWMAVAQAGGGWFAGINVLPLRDFANDGHSLPNSGKLTIWENVVASLVSGTSEEYKRAALLLAEHSKEEGKFSDVLALVDLQRSYLFGGGIMHHREVLDGRVAKNMDLEVIDTDLDCMHDKRAVHFDLRYSSVQSIITWMDHWNDSPCFSHDISYGSDLKIDTARNTASEDEEEVYLATISIQKVRHPIKTEMEARGTSSDYVYTSEAMSHDKVHDATTEEQDDRHASMDKETDTNANVPYSQEVSEKKEHTLIHDDEEKSDEQVNVERQTKDEIKAPLGDIVSDEKVKNGTPKELEQKTVFVNIEKESGTLSQTISEEMEKFVPSGESDEVDLQLTIKDVGPDVHHPISDKRNNAHVRKASTSGDVSHIQAISEDEDQSISSEESQQIDMTKESAEISDHRVMHVQRENEVDADVSIPLTDVIPDSMSVYTDLDEPKSMAISENYERLKRRLDINEDELEDEHQSYETK